MGNYNTSFLAKKREDWMNSLGKWQAYVNGAWYDATVNSIKVVDTEIIAYIYLPSNGRAGTVTGLRVYDTLGSLAASWSVSIERSNVQNTLFKVILPIEEV